MLNSVLFRLYNRGKLIASCKRCNTIFNHQLSIMAQAEQCFKGQLNRHNAVVVKSGEEPCELAEFPNRLTASLKEWTKSKRNAVWFEINAKEADWIPILVKANFKFHHARDDNVSMYKWLREDAICNVPHYAHTNIGVGAIVYNEDTEELLVVKEKGGLHNMWKLPGGYMDPDEDINDAIEREVLEETGISAKFKCILGFRHTHQHAFGCSDIYIVTYLKPVSSDIRKCPLEISECAWMKLSEYVEHSEVHENNKFIAKKMIEHLKTGIGVEAIHAVHPITKKPIVVYTINNCKT